MGQRRVTFISIFNTFIFYIQKLIAFVVKTSNVTHNAQSKRSFRADIQKPGRRRAGTRISAH